jgi:hypothetical protein
MSARLNMNKRRNISWKGRTFNQVVAGLKMNTNTFSTSSTQGFFLAPPIKHYRREIANTNASCKTRANVDGDAFFQPGGTINNTASSVPPSYVSEFDLTVIRTERPTNNCDTPACSKSADAKRRVRSSGNIKRIFSASNDTYYTSTNEYLISRNRTVKQNEVFSVRYGDPTYKPGEPNSIPNIYTPNGINHCAKVSIKGFSSSPLFQYQWIDATVNNFTIADGNYDMGELNSLFQTTLLNRGHYYNDSSNGSRVFLFNFVYNTLTDKAQIQCFATSDTIHTARYTIPNGASWVKPYGTIVPVIRILSNIFQTILGIPAGNYPPADISNPVAKGQLQPVSRLASPNDGYASNIYTPGLSAGVIQLYITNFPAFATGNQGNQFRTGTVNPTIGTPYIPLYYKPSNSKFASQGSVDSSARLTRLKYDTVTNSANTFLTAYGKQTANALAYSVPSPGYTIKDKVGYPAAKTPTVSRGIVTACETGKLRGG